MRKKRLGLIFFIFLIATALTVYIAQAKELEPDKFNVGNLRVNSDYRTDVSQYSNVIKHKLYWVPAAALGQPDTTVERLREFKGKPVQLKEEIDTLYEVLAYVQAVDMDNYSGNKIVEVEGRRHDNGADWQMSAYPEYVIENNRANCMAMANTVVYLLEGDYDEVGIVWWSSYSRGGHLYNYIKDNGKYYINSALPYTYATERTYPGPEEGGKYDFHGNRRGFVFEIPVDSNGKPNFKGIVDLEKPEGRRKIGSMILFPADKFRGVASKRENGLVTGMYVHPDFPFDRVVSLYEDPDHPIEYIAADFAPDWKRGLYK